MKIRRRGRGLVLPFSHGDDRMPTAAVGSTGYVRRYNFRQRNEDMKRRSVFAVLPAAAVGFLLPMSVLAKEVTVTLEITGMT